MVRRPGTTLVELMVTVFLFSLLMSLILGFYIYGTRITERRNRVSDNYRLAVQVADKVETLLKNAWVGEVGGDYVSFTPLDPDRPVSRRAPRPSRYGAVLAVLPGREAAGGAPALPTRLVLHDRQGTRTLLELPPSAAISFGPSLTGGLPPGYVDVNINLQSPMPDGPGPGQAGGIGLGKGRSLSFTRRVVLERL